MRSDGERVKAIDLYAAHALGALLSLRPDAPHEDDHDAIVRDAQRIAFALAEQMCGTMAHSFVDGRCERCMCARERPPAPRIPPPPPADMGPPKRIS